MKASVRLIAMTAPIHDAEVLASPDGELGVDNLVKFVETLDPNVVGWYLIDMTWLIEMDPLTTRHFTERFHSARIVVRAAEYVADGLDMVVVKSSLSDLADTFADARFDSGCSDLVKQTLGVMFDMVSGDFADVFGPEVDPRGEE